MLLAFLYPADPTTGDPLFLGVFTSPEAAEAAYPEGHDLTLTDRSDVSHLFGAPAYRWSTTDPATEGEYVQAEPYEVDQPAPIGG
jgi:hypothetical protein